MFTTHAARRAVLAASCGLVPLCQPARAQEATILPPVDVEAASAAQAIATAPLASDALTREDLSRRQSRTSDTADILRRIPGVSVNGGGGFSGMPAIRGLSEQRLRIVVDGQVIDVACPNDMNSPLSYTDPQTLAEIRVVPGVAPVSMGGDSIGGVISARSAPPRFATGPGLLVTGTVSAFYRSNGDGFGGASVLTVAGERLSLTYTGSYTRSEQYEGGRGKGLVASTEYAKTDHALALAAQTGAGLVTVRGGYHFSPYEGFANQWMDMTSNRSWFVTGGYEGDYDWGSVKWTANYRKTDHAMDFLEDKRPGSMPMNTRTRSFDTALAFDLPVSMHDTLRLGGEFHRERLDDWWPPVAGSMMMGPDPFVNVNGARRDRIGGHLEWERHWGGALSTLAGIRIDRVAMNTGAVQPYSTSMMNMADAMAAMAFNAADRRRTDTNWSGSLMATYDPGQGVAIEIGYARKVRSPDIYERYTWGRGAMASQMIGWYGDGNGYVGNLDLRPERADTLGMTLALGGGEQVWSLRLSPYYTHVSDYIDAAFVQVLNDMMGMPSPFVQLQFANREAQFVGVDLAGSWQLAGRKGQDGTVLSGSLAYLSGRNLADHGPLYHQMPLSATLALDHRRGGLELGAELEWVAAKTRVDATRNEPRTAAYALVNLSAAHTLGPVRLSVEAANLFDKGYDLPLGGMALGDYGLTGALRAVPGRGRSINLGASVAF